MLSGGLQHTLLTEPEPENEESFHDRADALAPAPRALAGHKLVVTAMAEPANSTIAVEIVSDAICPWCYVAKRSFEMASSQLPDGVKVSIHWLPFELNPDMPAEGMDRRAYRTAKFGSWEHSSALDRRVAQVASSVGLVMRHDLMQRTPNTIKAHRLIWLAARERLQDSVVEGLFSAYFTQGRDIGDVAVLTDIAAQAGMARARLDAFFAGDEGVEEVTELATAARQSGISSVPTFLIDGQPIISGAKAPRLILEQLLHASQSA